MAQASKGAVRAAGIVLILGAVLLFGIGDYLLYVVLDWAMPAWLPPALQVTPPGPAQAFQAAMDDPAGWAALYLLVFGAVAAVAGSWMLIFGRRNWVLAMPLLLLFLIFVVVGIWATLDNGHRIGQIGG